VKTPNLVLAVVWCGSLAYIYEVINKQIVVMSMSVGELVKEINKSILTVEELRILNQLVVRHIKANKKVEALKNSALLKEGDVVRVMHDKLAGLTGKIVQVKRTKAIVKITSTGNQYNVPMELIRSL
jgi:transcription antitermination factor NusG